MEQVRPLKNGEVFLVGAGPGDPELVTLKAKRLIETCDVLVYDYLLSPELLNWGRPECRRICAGKRAGFHSIKQEEIEEILVKEALAGLRVVRLKGGDPYVFGRGGEEVERLRRAGVRVEVVPAVTAALAAAARLQVPLTHRNTSSSVSFLTGHEDPDKGVPLTDWTFHARSPGTLCLYMSMKHLSSIVGELLAGGMSADRPAAAIQWISMPDERFVRCSVGTLVEEVEKAGLGSPAVVIIGEVVDQQQASFLLDQGGEDFKE